MLVKIKEVQSVQGNRIFYFESENVYYSVTVDQNNDYWLQLSGHYHTGNGGLSNIVKYIERIGIELNENITVQKYFSNK